jgi:hypothetical protein
VEYFIMSGTNPVASWSLPLSTGPSVQDPTTYKGNIDADIAVAQRVADAFAPRPASPAAMAVVLDAGFVMAETPAGMQSVVEVAQQTVTIASAPGLPNSRIDLVVIDAATGAASVITGTPANPPSPPAITAGKRQVALVSVPNGTSVISNANITDLRAVWGASGCGIPWAVAGGTADAITASYAPATPNPIPDGYVIAFRASAANVTTAPTFNPDGRGNDPITKQGGAPLVAGDIPAALAECFLRRNAANARWELLNPKAAPPPVTSVAGKTGAVTLTAGDIAGTAWTQSSLTNNNQLANGANYAVRGEPVSEFANNVGYISISGYLGVGSYTTYNSHDSFGPTAPGSTGGVSGFPGTWLCLGTTGSAAFTCMCGLGSAPIFLIQRIA